MFPLESHLRVVKLQRSLGLVISINRIHRVLEIDMWSLSGTKHKTNHPTETQMKVVKDKTTSAMQKHAIWQVIINSNTCSYCMPASIFFSSTHIMCKSILIMGREKESCTHI